MNEQDAGTAIECRSVEISQVLLNLLNNSFDAIQAQPKKWVKIRTFNNGETMQIQVDDSGPGIPEEIRSRLMQPFFTTKEVGKGTGLGLSISRGIVEAHGGKFFLDNSAKNTRFVIALPVGKERAQVA